LTLAVNLDALAVNLDALAVNLDALAVNLDALAVNLDALAVNLGACGQPGCLRSTWMRLRSTLVLGGVFSLGTGRSEALLTITLEK
jgi:hypothetical protein